MPSARAILPYAMIALTLGWAALATRCAETRGAERGVLAHELSRLRADSARLARRADALAAAYRVDTVRLRTVRTLTDSILVRDTLTFVRVDTVRQLVERERAACDLVISTCESRLAVADSQARRADSSAKLWRALAERQRCRILFLPCPNRLTVFVGGAALGAAAGVAATRR